jgi:hypothetical protein
MRLVDEKSSLVVSNHEIDTTDFDVKLKGARKRNKDTDNFLVTVYTN